MIFYDDAAYFDWSPLSYFSIRKEPFFLEEPIQLFYYFLGFFVNLPYLFIAVHLSNRVLTFSKNKSCFPIFFCATKVLSNTIYGMIYFTDISLSTYTDTIPARLYNMPLILKLASCINFFNQIILVLLYFGAPFAKAIHYISNFLYYSIIVFVIFLFCILFLKLPKFLVKLLFSLEGPIYTYFNPVYYGFISLDIFLLSQLTIFSQIKDYFPKKYLKSLKISIFMLCVSLLAMISTDIIYKFYTVINRSTTWYNRYGLLLSFIYEQFVDSVILTIIFYLANPKFEEVEKQELSNIDNVLNQRIEFME